MLDNDFVLLKLSQRVPLEANPHIRPICLPRPGEDVKGQAAIVAGWGSIDDGHSNIADVLLQANLTIMSNSDCLLDSKYPPHELTENMLCARSPVGESVQDACQGDSGGPLVARTGSGYYSLVGVVSWGYGCGVAEYPGVFARVTKVLLFYLNHNFITIFHNHNRVTKVLLFYHNHNFITIFHNHNRVTKVLLFYLNRSRWCDCKVLDWIAETTRDSWATCPRPSPRPSPRPTSVSSRGSSQAGSGEPITCSSP